jgi:hypothetical protein
VAANGSVYCSEGPASVDSFDRYLVQTGDVRGSLILATDANASEPFTILTGVTSFGLPNARRMTSQEPEPRAIFSRAAAPLSSTPCERRKRHDLPALCVEIARIEPSLKSFPDCWPFVIYDGVPSRIAIVSLNDLGVAEDPL